MSRPEYTQGVSVSTESTSTTDETLFAMITIGAAASEAKVGAIRLTERVAVMLQADEDNTGNVFVGINGVPTTTNASFRLSAGAGIIVSLDKYSDVPVHLIASAEGQKIYLTEIK